MSIITIDGQGYTESELIKNWAANYAKRETQQIRKEADEHKSAAVLDHPDGSVTTAKIADGAVTEGKLSKEVKDSIDTAQATADDAQSAADEHKSAAVLDHPDRSVTTAKIANGAVTEGKLSDDVKDSIVTAQATADDAQSAADNAQVTADTNADEIKKVKTLANTTAKDLELLGVVVGVNESAIDGLHKSVNTAQAAADAAQATADDNADEIAEVKQQVTDNATTAKNMTINLAKEVDRTYETIIPSIDENPDLYDGLVTSTTDSTTFNRDFSFRLRRHYQNISSDRIVTIPAGTIIDHSNLSEDTENYYVSISVHWEITAQGVTFDTAPFSIQGSDISARDSYAVNVGIAHDLALIGFDIFMINRNTGEVCEAYSGDKFKLFNSSNSDTPTVITDDTGYLTLKNGGNYLYSNTAFSALQIVLPSNAKAGFLCGVTFLCGSDSFNLATPDTDTIKYNGVDCSFDGVFIPTNTGASYDLVYCYNGHEWKCCVG